MCRTIEMQILINICLLAAALEEERTSPTQASTGAASGNSSTNNNTNNNNNNSAASGAAGGDGEKSEALTSKQRYQIKHRELFLSRQVESIPATQIRGKCSVTLLNETESLQSYLNKDVSCSVNRRHRDCFIYQCITVFFITGYILLLFGLRSESKNLARRQGWDTCRQSLSVWYTRQTKRHRHRWAQVGGAGVTGVDAGAQFDRS